MKSYYKFQGIDQERRFLSSEKMLNHHQFRTISWEANSCYQNDRMAGSSAYFLLAEIAWFRVCGY